MSEEVLLNKEELSGMPYTVWAVCDDEEVLIAGFRLEQEANDYKEKEQDNDIYTEDCIKLEVRKNG